MSGAVPLRPAAFLDRDGVLIRDTHHLRTVEEVELLPGAAAAVRHLRDAGYAVVVVTNQSAVARGLLDEGTLRAIHARLEALLSEQGAALEAIYHCPHHPTAGLGALRRDCACRKPEPGMIRQACDELGLDPSRSLLVGDKASDIGAAVACGIRAFLVRTGHGRDHEPRVRELYPATEVVDDLAAAAERAVGVPIGAPR